MIETGFCFDFNMTTITITKQEIISTMDNEIMIQMDPSISDVDDVDDVSDTFPVCTSVDGLGSSVDVLKESDANSVLSALSVVEVLVSFHEML